MTWELLMGELTKNTILHTTEGEEIKVVPFSSKKFEIGSGGQGIVYKVLFRDNEYALKWYFDGSDEKFYNNLKHNVENGSPADTFLWPIAITEVDENNCFGYVMRLRTPEYKEFKDILSAKEQFSDFSAIVNAALQICASFKQLHSSGFSYQDMNDGNCFINTTTGDVLICDNDNVAPNRQNLGILGTAGYMAPEIVNPDMDIRPDKYSDRFSLSVLLFRMLFKNHPLEGNLVDPDDPSGENMNDILWRKPIFIFDPKDSSNRPNVAIHGIAAKKWPIYPPFIHDAFIKAFDKSVMNCNGVGREDRPFETDWCKEFTHLRNSITVCPKCKKETFFPMKNQSGVCMRCKEQIHRPSVLVLTKDTSKTIPLYKGSKIYIYEIDEMHGDFTIENIKHVVGEVVENKKQPGLYGIKNLSDFPWYRHTPGGRDETIEPGDGVVIAKDNIIKFGTFSEWMIQE